VSLECTDWLEELPVREKVEGDGEPNSAAEEKILGKKYIKRKQNIFFSDTRTIKIYNEKKTKTGKSTLPWKQNPEH
jgi:uncharacterized protein YqkB